MLSVSARFVPRSDLGRFVDIHISPAVYAAVQASCEEVQAVAQALCPVDTGALQASITIDPLIETEKSVVGRVGPHTDYAEYVEYGTGRRGAESPGAGAGPYKSDWAGQAAQPYMRPALDETRPKVLEAFRNNIAEALA